MTFSTDETTTQSLSLTEELLLMLINEESGYFHQVPGWNLNCAVIGAVLAELSLRSRIDTDLESLFLVDETETGRPSLDPILKEIAAEPVRRTTQYWIERLAPHAESIIDLNLDRLVEMKVLEHHEGGFWTLSSNTWKSGMLNGTLEGTADQFVKNRIGNVIFKNEIPDPRDVIIICLINTCDIFRFMFQLDREAEERIQVICRMDLLGQSIAEAVVQNLAVPLRRQSALTKKIPTASLHKMLFNPHTRRGNIPALFADLAHEYGPVFQIRPPFSEPMIVLADPETNHWVHRRGRMYLRARDYFVDFERVYGASGVLPSLDGAEHFRLRKSLTEAYSRKRLAERMDELYDRARRHMAQWKVGESYQATDMSRRMINAQISPFMVGVETQDIIEDLLKFKERALSVHIVRILPKFMMNTPGMKRRAKFVETLIERIMSVRTHAQRTGQHRDLVDDYLSLHASDPQFVPESNLRFAFTAALVASAYLGDAFSFTLYAMASQPDMYARIQREADAMFGNGDPDAEDFSPSKIDVTHRFMMECLRLYPVVPMSFRNVMNACVVEGYELPVGSRVLIAQTATHYMEDVFPDPFKFDIDRYLPPRDEHLNPGYAPFGLGTHTCLGSRWMELQLAVNVLMVAHYFELEVSPANFKLRFNPIPSMKPSGKLKFLVAERRRELNV